MSIGVNWKEVWKDVWKAVWRQAAVVDDDAAPKPSRRPFRSRLTRLKPVQPKPSRAKRYKKRVKLLPQIILPPPVAPVVPVTSLERYAGSLSPSPPIEGVLSSTLSGCTLKMEGKTANKGRISATLDGVEMEMNVKAMMYDDAVSIFLGMPELEPDLVDA